MHWGTQANNAFSSWIQSSAGEHDQQGLAKAWVAVASLTVKSKCSDWGGFESQSQKKCIYLPALPQEETGTKLHFLTHSTRMMILDSHAMHKQWAGKVRTIHEPSQSVSHTRLLEPRKYTDSESPFHVCSSKHRSPTWDKPSLVLKVLVSWGPAATE